MRRINLEINTAKNQRKRCILYSRFVDRADGVLQHLQRAHSQRDERIRVRIAELGPLAGTAERRRNPA